MDATTFMRAPQFFFTSESVTEGHPDKICDQVSDAILDELLAQDPMSRVACETATTTGLIVVLGEVTTKGYVEVQDIVRKVVSDIGYTRGKFGFDAETCGIVATELGAGRARKEDAIDPAVGLVLERKVGEPVQAGEALLTVHAADQQRAEVALAALKSAITISATSVEALPLVFESVA